MRIARTIAAALLTMTVGTGAVRAELCNYFCPCPAGNVNVNTYNIVLAGNVINQLNLAATATDPNVNPFVKAGGTSTVTASLDGNGNTVVTFTGSQSINSSDTFIYGPNANGLPHFGLDGTGAALNIISHSWANNSGSFPLPAVSIALVGPPPVGGDVDYLIMYVQATDPGITAGFWTEHPFADNGAPPQVMICNYTSSDQTLSDAGFFISETPIPLDSLNFGSLPPPDVPGSPFIPLPSVDGVTLGAGDGTGGVGQCLTVTAVPEPSSAITLGMGMLVLAGAGSLTRRRLTARLVRTTAVD